ncbi:hypothetical protein TSAR_001493 [Trichomalopsis sarcophagae]|uniref:Uncharacterized protein n=1 Tax=Trichomalopsis sarcophagae TaxID=543379 RepID=A0A232EDN5_9HYME|nr:hypothetical protein TSAR_001493 [Trichomalopsis sarcophagae]
MFPLRRPVASASPTRTGAHPTTSSEKSKRDGTIASEKSERPASAEREKREKAKFGNVTNTIAAYGKKGSNIKRELVTRELYQQLYQQQERKRLRRLHPGRSPEASGQVVEEISNFSQQKKRNILLQILRGLEGVSPETRELVIRSIYGGRLED